MMRLALLFAVAFAGDSPGPDDSKEPPKEIYRVWMHSAEEDTETVEVYRPEGFDFPRARGREGFEVKPKGVFVLHAIAPTDGIERIVGKWTCKDPNVVSVTFPDVKPRELLPGEFLNPPEPRTLHIVSCDAKVLKIKKRPPG